MNIDAHHHLWKYTAQEYDWIDESMSILRKDFLLDELSQVCDENDIDGTIVVQARQSLEETHWLLQLASQSSLIKGVVGWIDIKSADLSQQLATLANKEKLVAFRHVIQGESDANFMLNSAFISGLKVLAQHGYRYDLLIYAHQLPTAIQMLEQIPELKVVIDHIAKPNIKTKQDFQQWQHDMQTLAKNKNVYCKLSGMITETDWNNWKVEELQPYMSSVYQYFGSDRIMFGSDWPVCLLAGQYPTVKQIVKDFILAQDETALNEVFGENALRFYQIN